MSPFGPFADIDRRPFFGRYRGYVEHGVETAETTRIHLDSASSYPQSGVIACVVLDLTAS